MPGNDFGINLAEPSSADQRPLWHCASRPPTHSKHRRGGVMTIGQLSHRTGVSVKALRRYVDMGLVYSLGRSSAGYRLFDDTALGCVHGIQALRALGLTEVEIAELADRHAQAPGDPVGPHLDAVLHRARERIAARIGTLEQIRQRIDQYRSNHGPSSAAAYAPTR